MIRKNVLLFVCCSSLIGLGLVGLAQQSAQKPATLTATEAPAGFKTPTLSKHPGSKSVSNGIPEPPNDTFAIDQANFEAREGNDTGLGPVHNATICADCHQGTGTGGPSQVTEVRAGHLDANGNFVNPTIFINRGKDMMLYMCGDDFGEFVLLPIICVSRKCGLLIRSNKDFSRADENSSAYAK
jgi:hypothetical protein